MDNFVQVLEQEQKTIKDQVDLLNEKATILDQVIRAYRTDSKSGFGVHTGGNSHTEETSNYTIAVQTGKPKAAKKAGMSTMDMARQILDNHGSKGKELSLRDIQKGIRDTFGTEPASSLGQMLYKRAHARNGFYRTSAGLYGRAEWLGKSNKAA